MESSFQKPNPNMVFMYPRTACETRTASPGSNSFNYCTMTILPLFVKAMLLFLLTATLANGEEKANPEQAVAKPHVWYFYDPGCRMCADTNKAVTAATEKYGNKVVVEQFNTIDPKTGMASMERMFGLLDEMGVPEDDTPKLALFIGEIETIDGNEIFKPRALLTEDDIAKNLDAALQELVAEQEKLSAAAAPTQNENKKESAENKKDNAGIAEETNTSDNTAVSDKPTPSEQPAEKVSPENTDKDDSDAKGDKKTTEPKTGALKKGPSVFNMGQLANVLFSQAAAGESVSHGDTAAPVSPRVKKRLEAELRFGTISLNALADGINPCAFATVVLLVAMMSTAKRSRRDILAIGVSFTASVYLTYFAIGLFFYEVVNLLKSQGGWYLVAADLVYYLAWGLCVVCAILALRDAYLSFIGRSHEEMTLQLPDAFKRRMRTSLAKGVRARWLMLGVFATGITVSFLEAACTGQVYWPTVMLMAEMPFWEMALLLAWYNFLFVLPLIIVFALAFFGITNEQIGGVSKKYMWLTKLALGIVFLLMAIWLWGYMFWPPGYRGA